MRLVWRTVIWSVARVANCLLISCWSHVTRVSTWRRRSWMWRLDAGNHWFPGSLNLAHTPCAPLRCCWIWKMNQPWNCIPALFKVRPSIYIWKIFLKCKEIIWNNSCACLLCLTLEENMLKENEFLIFDFITLEIFFLLKFKYYTKVLKIQGTSYNDLSNFQLVHAFFKNYYYLNILYKN